MGMVMELKLEEMKKSSFGKGITQFNFGEGWGNQVKSGNGYGDINGDGSGSGVRFGNGDGDENGYGHGDGYTTIFGNGNGDKWCNGRGYGIKTGRDERDETE